jgi:hypothetical protein
LFALKKPSENVFQNFLSVNKNFAGEKINFLNGLGNFNLEKFKFKFRSMKVIKAGIFSPFPLPPIFYFCP